MARRNPQGKEPSSYSDRLNKAQGRPEGMGVRYLWAVEASIWLAILAALYLIVSGRLGE